ncbi:MAG: N-acetylmuramoyl-L-alanine amidase family protein, partial [Gemmatimonadota bacterium]
MRLRPRTTPAVLAAVCALALPGAAVAQDAPYPTVAWTEVPVSMVSEAGYRGGFGTGVAASGDAVELRPGSPFVRLGERVVQLVNAPYLDGGRLRVPRELLERPEFEDGASATASAASEVSLPPVVEGENTRRPGPWRVIIDPGHGGHDPGTQSPRTRAAERDITLAVSKMVHDELSETPDIDPWLTRTRDVFIDVPDRPRLAVEREGDLFVSIHVDAERRPGTSARGFTTYYLGPARTERGREAAMRENTVPGAEDRESPNIEQLEFILAGLDQGTHLQESVRFGGFIQNELRDVVDSPDRGVRSGPYWVLVRATSNMPTVLVELGFITNPKEERRLRDAGHQREMAGVVARAVRRYLDDKGERLDA